MVIFDATAIMRLQEENRNVFDRHALLVSPTDGRLATFVWALERDSKGTYHLASGKIRKLPRGLEEDRKLYVDRSRFVLGLPAQEAFALLDLPPGDTITPSAELQEAAEMRPANARGRDAIARIAAPRNRLEHWPTGRKISSAPPGSRRETSRNNRRMKRLLGKLTQHAWQLVVFVVALSATATTIAAAESVEALIAHGVRLESGEVAPLAKPQMPDGLTAAEQQVALRTAAGKYPVAQFTRRSVVAPFSLDISAVDDTAGHRRGQHVEFCFVAYGQLGTVVAEDLFGALAGTQETRRADGPDTAARALTAGELRARGLTANKTAEREESFVLVDVPILNRVQLRGVGFAVRERRANSIIAALVLDDRFRDDEQFPNTWSPLRRSAGKALHR